MIACVRCRSQSITRYLLRMLIHGLSTGQRASPVGHGLQQAEQIAGTHGPHSFRGVDTNQDFTVFTMRHTHVIARRPDDTPKF
jgi:hypothetical protein